MLTVNGLTASLRWSYYEAGVLGAWALTVAGGVRSLTAQVIRADAFRVSQRPLVFVAPHATGAWRWPVVELQIEGATLTATLGPKE